MLFLRSHLCDKHNTSDISIYKHKKKGTCSFFLVLMLMLMSLVLCLSHKWEPGLRVGKYRWRRKFDTHGLWKQAAIRTKMEAAVKVTLLRALLHMRINWNKLLRSFTQFNLAFVPSDGVYTIRVLCHANQISKAVNSQQIVVICLFFTMLQPNSACWLNCGYRLL